MGWDVKGATKTSHMVCFNWFMTDYEEELLDILC